MSATTAAPQASSSSSANRPELPWSFYECPTETLVVLISHMLNLLIQHNDQVILTPDSLTRFHSRAAPGITVVDYLQRIVKYTNMEKIPLLSLLAYIDVTCTNLPTFTLSSLTVHRFLIAGVCAGSKAQCDVFCTNSHYAKVGGIKVTELNGLEREFLKVTQWDLCCKAELLQRYYTSLIKSHGGFVQAAEPADNPLTALPVSASGDGSVQGDVADMIHTSEERTDAEQPTTESSTVPSPGPVDIPFQPNKRGRRRESQAGSSSVPERGEGVPSTSDAGRTTPIINSAPGSTSRMDMDVDDQVSPSSNIPASSSPASSSVPSSSRSSLRAREVSRTQLAPTISETASPRVDMAQATGRVGMDIDAQNTLPHDSIASVIAIDTDSTSTSQPVSEHESQGRETHHTGPGGKLLKSLGGIFRWHDPAHHSDPPPSTSFSTNGTSPSTSQSILNTNNPNSGSNNRLIPPHQSPGRRVKSPLMTAYPQGEAPAMGAPVTPRVRTRGETTSEC